MLAKVYSAILDGLEGKIVEVETGLMSGLSNFMIVGLADKAIQEAKERLTLALKSINAKPPTKFNKKTIINLAPADIKKEGTGLDLAIAISFLIASKQIKNINKKILFLGELSLDGKLRRIKGCLPIVLSLEKYFEEIYLPKENIEEIRHLKTNKIFLFDNLLEVIEHIESKKIVKNFQPEETNYENIKKEEDISFIKISEYILNAIIIGISGKHNLFLFGPPGTGKTLIATNVVKLMPNLTYEQSLEVTSIYSAAGFNIENFIFTPPFRSPHHSSSLVSIIGGGTNPRPGEVTLAHHGVLFLDELPEFKRDVIEALREPLESGEITIARAKKTIKFPAKFLLIAASNPCPCGFYKDEEKECICSINEIKKYSKKLSGPILDRIDILINVPRIKGEEIFKEKEINFKKIIDKIKELKEIQLKRQGKYNGELLAKELKDYCKLDLNSENLLSEAADKMKISLRGIHKIIKIARTIADLNNNDKIKQEYIAQAIHYHLQDKEKLITV